MAAVDSDKSDFGDDMALVTSIPDTSQWFPAVVCWVERGNDPPLSIQLLIEYENTKMGTSLIHTKDVRICHDFDWYVQSLLAQFVNV